MHRARRWIAVPLATLTAVGLAIGATAAPAGAGDTPSCSGPSGPSGPDDAAAQYVCNLYVRLLLRSQVPSGAEITYWVGQIEATSRAQVVRAFERSRENAEVLVTQDYLDLLGRSPDADGLAYWVGILQRNAPLELVDAGILATAEGFQAQGGTNDDFVDALYGLYLDRVPNDQELAYWSGQITAHGNDARARGSVVLQIELSSEGRALTADTLYGYWLNRPGDAGGLAYWADRILHRGIMVVEAEFVAADEVFAAQSS